MRYEHRKNSTIDKLNEGFERDGRPVRARRGYLDDFSGFDALLDSYFDEDENWKDDMGGIASSVRM